MSFGWHCYDKDKNNLFDKYDINCQALSLGSDKAVSNIRSLVNNNKWAHEYTPAAKELFISIQNIIKDEIIEYPLCHCDTCTCISEPPKGMDVEQAKRFLSINPDDVCFMGGGY